MDAGVKEQMKDRATKVFEVICVVVAYFGILALMIYPVLMLTGFLK